MLTGVVPDIYRVIFNALADMNAIGSRSATHNLLGDSQLMRRHLVVLLIVPKMPLENVLKR